MASEQELDALRTRYAPLGGRATQWSQRAAQVAEVPKGAEMLSAKGVQQVLGALKSQGVVFRGKKLESLKGTLATSTTQGALDLYKQLVNPMAAAVVPQGAAGVQGGGGVSSPGSVLSGSDYATALESMALGTSAASRKFPGVEGAATPMASAPAYVGAAEPLKNKALHSIEGEATPWTAEASDTANKLASALGPKWKALSAEEKLAAMAGGGGAAIKAAGVASEGGFLKGVLGTVGKVGGGIVLALTVADAARRLYGITVGPQQERFADLAGTGLEGIERGRQASALGYERGVGNLLDAKMMSDRVGGVPIAADQDRQEAELMGMLNGRAQQLQMISQQYRPSLAETMARAGIMP